MAPTVNSPYSTSPSAHPPPRFIKPGELSRIRDALIARRSRKSNSDFAKQSDSRLDLLLSSLGFNPVEPVPIRSSLNLESEEPPLYDFTFPTLVLRKRVVAPVYAPSKKLTLPHSCASQDADVVTD